ncbi:ricin B lectin domain-containing protein [Radiomyces spectabilis]|uniref:ricin B lectin domain-containing protein n=1 Tax=Radiomyces spectabilis TaxID=64574 RepID=UPI00222038BD|nr:ricin B lectin domain-containing protein [Radiomyces spectabilis]KAI8384677.1 ricin B lectin domain-containing protein [Radiomyces spectabilis]
MFPQGYFYILSRKHGFALDVYDGQTKEDANIIVWPQKFQDSDNQLWKYENGQLINKKSGHALDIRSSAFKKDKVIVQNKRKPNHHPQEWIFDNGFICSQAYPTMVFDIKGDSEKGGAQVLLYKRKESDNMNQLWYFEPYQHFEGALNLATTSISLHKKADFGQPRLGYGAEVGVPPQLKKLPDNCKVAGVGGEPTPTPSANTANENHPNVQNSQLPENVATLYSGTPTQSGPQPFAQHPPQVSSPSTSSPSPYPYASQSPTYNTPSGYPPAPVPAPPVASHPGYSPQQPQPQPPQPASPHVGGFYRPPAPQDYPAPSGHMPMPGANPPEGYGGGYPPPGPPPLPARDQDQGGYGAYPPPLPSRLGNDQAPYGGYPPPPQLPPKDPSAGYGNYGGYPPASPAAHSPYGGYPPQ